MQQLAVNFLKNHNNFSRFIQKHASYKLDKTDMATEKGRTEMATNSEMRLLQTTDGPMKDLHLPVETNAIQTGLQQQYYCKSINVCVPLSNLWPIRFFFSNLYCIKLRKY